MFRGSRQPVMDGPHEPAVNIPHVNADGTTMRKALGIALFFVAALASPQSAMKEVVYEVDGTAKYANLTLTNKDGGKEQSQVKLPFELKFYGKVGQFLYLSAQKTRVTKIVPHVSRDIEEVVYDGIAGTAHVLIRVNGTVLQEASSDAPYGVATVDGKLPD